MKTVEQTRLAKPSEQRVPVGKLKEFAEQFARKPKGKGWDAAEFLRQLRSK